MKQSKAGYKRHKMTPLKNRAAYIAQHYGHKLGRWCNYYSLNFSENQCENLNCKAHVSVSTNFDSISGTIQSSCPSAF